MTYQSITLDPDTDLFLDFIRQVDEKLPIIGTGNPQGVVAAALPGIFFLDQSSGAFYFCTQTDGTPENTVWVPTAFNIPISSPTTQGIIALATALEVAAGTNALKALTPATAAATYAKKGANTDLTSITGLTTPLAANQGGTGQITYFPLPDPAGQAGKTAVSDGTDYVLQSAPTAGIPVIILTANGPLTANNFHLVTASGLTLALPTTPPVGTVCRFGFAAGVTGTIINGGKIMNADTTMTVDVNTSFSLIYVNSSLGWWVIG